MNGYTIKFAVITPYSTAEYSTVFYLEMNSNSTATMEDSGGII